MGYKTHVDQFQGIFKPFEAVMKANNLDALTVTKNLAQNHHDLATGTLEQRAQVAVRLLESYGIGAKDLLDGYESKAAAPQQTVMPPEFAEMRKELDLQKQATYNQLARETKVEFDAFVANPENRFYKELENDIAELFETGASNTLAEAYEIAKWRNPGVRVKALQELEEKRATGAKAVADKAKKASKFTLRSDGNESPPPKGSMEAGMRDIIAKHYS